jgi:hypothetical protein
MTRIILTLIAVFASGFVIDLLSTKYTQAVANKRVWFATVLSGLLTIAHLGLMAYLISDCL